MPAPCLQPQRLTLPFTGPVNVLVVLREIFEVPDHAQETREWALALSSDHLLDEVVGLTELVRLFQDAAVDIQTERDELRERLLRKEADISNLRKRSQRESEGAEQRGIANALSELSDGLDSITIAVEHSEGDDSASAQGLRAVSGQFQAALRRLGITYVDPSGQPFEPSWMEALSMRASEEHEKGVVIETMQDAMFSGERNIRPARVVVAS